MAQNSKDKNILTLRDEERHILREAIFSAQYQRKLSIKYFLLTKKSVFIISAMLILNYYDLLHLYLGMALTMYLMFSFLKNDINMHERENETNGIWLLKIKKNFIQDLEDEYEKDVENRSRGEFLKEFSANYNKV